LPIIPRGDDVLLPEIQPSSKSATKTSTSLARTSKSLEACSSRLSQCRSTAWYLTFAFRPRRAGGPHRRGVAPADCSPAFFDAGPVRSMTQIHQSLLQSGLLVVPFCPGNFDLIAGVICKIDNIFFPFTLFARLFVSDEIYCDWNGHLM
jgi:hypothetical protein